MSKQSYLIEITKAARKFFLTKYEGKHQLTWMKDSAITFNSIEETKGYIDTNKLEEDILFTPSTFNKIYDIKEYSEVSNH